MTKRLEETFKRVSALSAEEQDLIATEIDAMLEDDFEWNRRFDNTPESAFSKMADRVRQMTASGLASPLTSFQTH